tara:strand:+ start:1832 stop:2185 length:354 start_codon:yes stop_codon:yes gene_type:complete
LRLRLHYKWSPDTKNAALILAPLRLAVCVLSSPELARLNDQEYIQWYIQRYGLSAMTKLKVDEDIRPLSDFRAGIASFVKQINETHRPIVLTQRGRGVAVLVGVHEYQKMQQRLAGR